MLEKIKRVMNYVELLSKESKWPISSQDYKIEDLGCPHNPPKNLPKGCCAVYIFIYGDEALKIGKANSKSRARFTNQHYGFNAKSTLAKSLYDDKEFTFHSKEEIGSWMANNLRRINIIVKDINGNGKAMTELIEATMHYFFRPRYEGALY